MGMGEDIVQRIDALLKERNEKRLSLAEHCGFSLQSLSDWSKRGSVPSADKAVAIANYLGVSIEWLLTGSEKEGLTPKQRELIRNYETLSDRDKRAVDALIASLLTSENAPAGELKESAPVYRAGKKTPPLSKTAANTAEEPTPEYAPEKKLHAQNYDSRNTVDAIKIPPEKKKGSLEFLDVGEIIMIPCRGITAAGSPIDIYSVPDEYIPFPKKLLPGGNPEDYFFVNLHGVSMTQADMNDGDYVLIRRCNEPQVGKIMLVQHDGESTLKKIEMDKNGLYRLCWQDGSGRTQTIDSENWSVLGVYCWTIKGWRK